ncbi:MAG TPA: ribosome small subunit-dependent GTPase A [Luteibaculaceae bacterium]|nr:ribosome small subunit-dependent GTPase A [Luteibaculaceae bacterium]
MKGRVLKSTGSFYQVQLDSGVVECRIKGKFRMKGLVTTNPVAVGDWVEVELEAEAEGRGMIVDIAPRTNYLIRRSTNLSKQAHVVAANIDLACLVVTLAAPPTSFGFIDRFLVTAEAFDIPVLLVFNKVDLLVDFPEALDEAVQLYESVGYQTIRTSIDVPDSIAALRARVAGKVCLFSGHSGVGKSSLVKAMYPHFDIRVGDISMAHMKGQHTTTFAEMHQLPDGGYMVDTPGIKGFGIIDIEKTELGLYFPEMKELLDQCKFYNCKHLNEPGCAVKAAVDEGLIPPTRYASYQAIMQDDEGPYR